MGLLKPGTRIERYEIGEPVGAGGMGVVYRVTHTVLRREMALKALADVYALNEKVRHRFRQEAYVQSQLVHPHIVAVTDFVAEDDTLGLVMALIDGPSLEEVLHAERPGPWPVKDVVTLMLPVVHAMAYAHRRGVVHRDLKPGNILLDRRHEEKGVPHVTDFGLAKILSDEADLTKTGTQMGTAPYMAPEQFNGLKTRDARADVFALGILLWRLLTGRLPVDPANTKEVLAFYAGTQPLPTWSETEANAPAALTRLIDRMTALEPSARPDDAGEVLEALERIQADVTSYPLSAPPAVDVTAPSYAPEPLVTQAAYPGPSGPPGAGPDAHLPSIVQEATASPRRRRRVMMLAGAAAIGVVLFYALRPAPVPKSPLEGVPPNELVWAKVDYPGQGLRPFRILVSEVTVAQYRDCVSAGICEAPHWRDGTCRIAGKHGILTGPFFNPSQPQTCVTVDQARRFCHASRPGSGLSELPTEREYAAVFKLGFTHGANRPSAGEPPTCDEAVTRGCAIGAPAVACSRPRGLIGPGLCDILGNVWEYVHTPRKGSALVAGGAFTAAASATGNLREVSLEPVYDVGFRCVYHPAEPAKPPPPQGTR